MFFGPIINTDMYNKSSDRSSSGGGRRDKDTGFFSNGYQPNNLSGVKLEKYGKTIGQTSMKGSKNLKGSSMNDQQIWRVPTNNNLYVWVGTDGESVYNPLDGADTYGYYQLVGEDGKLYDNATSVNFSANQAYAKYKNSPFLESQANPFPNRTTDENKQTYTTPGYSVSKSYDVTKDKNYIALANRLKDLEKMYAEATRVWSADEVAKHLNVDYNEQNILNELNAQTNEYYDDAVAEQQELRNDYIKNNASYLQQITDSYLDSNKYVAPTATNRGIQAANMLATNMSADATNSMNDYGMQQNIQNQEAYRQAELAKNPSLAKQYYTGLGKELSNWSATKNTSDVQQYVDQLKAYTNYYAANRAGQAYLSQANAAKYAGLAGAAQNNAYNKASATNSNAAMFQKMYDFYYNTHNKDSRAASKYVADLIDSSAGQ